MARFNVTDADNYGGQGGGGYFSLKNNHDTARVRFMYNGIEDVEAFSVHELDIPGSKKKLAVNCLREYGSPIDDCPFCKAGKPTRVKYYIPLYNISEGRVEIWERGKQFGNKLSSMCSRYKNLVSHIFEIERNGEAGDQQTTYEIYEIEQDNTTLEDLPEVTTEVLGKMVQDRSAEEMQYYLDRNVFPDDNSAGINRNSNNEVARRTPAGGTRREAF